MNKYLIIRNNLITYLKNRPMLLALLRAKEASLFQLNLPLKKPVMDIGVGDGFFAGIVFGFKKNSVDVGLDVAGSRINQADRTGIYKKTVIYDGRKMEFKNNSFSTIISNSTLEHVSHLDDVLKETKRVLKKDGAFITTVVAKPWADHYFGNKIFGDSYKKWMTDIQVHTNLYTDKQWDAAFKKAGFKIVKKTGHAGPMVSTWTDILHFLSLPNLLTYKLFNKWVLFPDLAGLFFPVKYFLNLVGPDYNVSEAVCLYYELKPAGK